MNHLSAQAVAGGGLSPGDFALRSEFVTLLYQSIVGS